MSTITESLLIQIEPIIVELVEKDRLSHIQEDKIWTSYHEKMKRWDLTYYMLRSIVTYTKPTDELDNFFIHRKRGEFIIDMIIIRENKTYHLTTDIIKAGGYNIQELHLRYITNTSLPKENDLSSIKYIKDKIKNITKVEKLQNEIISIQLDIDTTTHKILESELLSDEEILLKDKHWVETSKLTWSIIVERGADKNYDYNQSKFEESQLQYRQSKINFFKSMNIIGQYQRIKSLEKSIKRIQSKIDKINE